MPCSLSVQADAAIASGIPYKKFQRQRKFNWYGCVCFFAYIVALGFYMYIRAAKTLGLGSYFSYAPSPVDACSLHLCLLATNGIRSSLLVLSLAYLHLTAG